MTWYPYNPNAGQELQTDAAGVNADRGFIAHIGIVGANAGELISEGVLAIEMGAVAQDLAMSIHPHPTLSETVMESAEAVSGQSTHVYRRK